MTAMPKKKEYEWEISRIKGKAAAFIGITHAPDEKSALKAAIAEFKIINPEHQKRLIARRRN